MPTFSSLKDLEKYIETQLQDVMEDEVAETVKDNMHEAIQTSVYDMYSPTYYHRRYDNGGLGDINKMDVTPIEKGIEIKDNAPLDNGRNDYALDDIIVNRGVLGYPQGRDFYEATADRLNQNKEHIIALKNGLKKRGIEIETDISIKF